MGNTHHVRDGVSPPVAKNKKLVSYITSSLLVPSPPVVQNPPGSLRPAVGPEVQSRDEHRCGEDVPKRDRDDVVYHHVFYRHRGAAQHAVRNEKLR